MQWRDAERLREEWGNKSCEHPNYEKEYHRGADTMDKVCTQCGEVLSEAEIERIKRQKGR